VSSPGLRTVGPAVMGSPFVWLASMAAEGIPHEQIVATEFAEWLRRPTGDDTGIAPPS